MSQAPDATQPTAEPCPLCGALPCDQVNDAAQKRRAALPVGYRILNDGLAREVLVKDEWEEGYVFPTVEEAAAYAWAWEGNNAGEEAEQNGTQAP